MDKELLFEIVSACTGSSVKHHTECRNGTGAELTVHNFLPTTLLSTFRSPSYTDYAGLFVSLKSPTGNDVPDCAGGAGKTSVAPEMFVDFEEFHDPQYDYDFRKLSNSDAKCERGGEPYTRPKGWYRYALKVRGKYSDGNTWLGPKGWRNYSVPGEWPVSYHGTGLFGAEGVVEDHFKPGPRQVFGRGIYSTPKLSVAESYAKHKPFKSKNGKTYRIILQNRINPDMKKVCGNKDYWLIPIPEGTSKHEEERIAKESIRAYGILVKEVVC